jgi:hypothetical protein
MKINLKITILFCFLFWNTFASEETDFNEINVIFSYININDAIRKQGSCDVSAIDSPGYKYDSINDIFSSNLTSFTYYCAYFEPSDYSRYPIEHRFDTNVTIF